VLYAVAVEGMEGGGEKGDGKGGYKNS